MNLNDRINLLVADDHKIIIDGIRSMLQDTPSYHIDAWAGNGHEAFSLIREDPGRFGILVTDINMPGMPGTDLCRMVKEAYPHIKVLVLSMYSTPGIIREAINAEADGYMLKDSGVSELLKALHKITNDGTYYSNEIAPVIFGKRSTNGLSLFNRFGLTAREMQVLSLIVNECTSEEIAGKLFISKKTVDNHRTRLLEKTGCRSAIGLVKLILQYGLE